MNEVEMSAVLGIILDPEKNRLSVSQGVTKDLLQVSTAILEMKFQKAFYGNLNEDIWLEFIPWHSLN